jgi:hypothetical protein
VIRALLLPILPILLFSLPASGMLLRRCHEPPRPFCQENDTDFQTDWRFQMCRSEIESFRIQVQEFLDCQRRNEREVVESLNRVIEQFNCRARGQRFCP